jgi:hypothetical protein
MNGKNLPRIYVVEIKIVSLYPVARATGKKRGEKTPANWIKLLKTNVEKMSVFRLSTILMKTNELNPSLHDVDEKKGS